MAKTLFITGGSRGIGASVVRAAAGKYNVAFTYLSNRDKARALIEELKNFGGIEAFKCDVSEREDVFAAVAAAKKRFGRIDALVNNAGISQSKLFQDIAPEEWRKIFAVNLDGAFNAVQAVLPDMLQNRSGAIVNVSSVWGQSGASMESAYSASKAALIGLTQALSKELAPTGITVNAVAPGAVDTDMMKDYSKEDVAALCESIPVGRLARPSEIASAVMFLLESEYVTGAVLPVNGGWL